MCKSQLNSMNNFNNPFLGSHVHYPVDLPFGSSMDNYQLGLSPQLLFLNLLSPIQPNLFPPNLMAIKNNLNNLILSNEIEVGPVINYLNKFQNLDLYDYMIAGLLSLRDSLPTNCPLKEDLGQLIMQCVSKRCQAKSENNFINFPSYPILRQTAPPMVPPMMPIMIPPPMERPTFVQIPQQQLSCERITNIINRMKTLLAQSNCNKCGGTTGNNNYLPILKDISQAERRRSIDSGGTNFLLQSDESLSLLINKIIDILPKPQNDIETAYFNTVKAFLKSEKINSILQGVALDFNNSFSSINVIFQKVINSNVDTTIKTSFAYYLHKMSKKSTTTELQYDFSTLIDLLPQPLDEEEKEKFAIVAAFLRSKDIYKYVENIDQATYLDKKLLFETVLKTLANSQLDLKISQAFMYYSKYTKSLMELQLFSKREITKRFELTKIFIDTLDIDSLSNDAKLSFKKFFKFISTVNKEQLKDFDSWSDVKTKGEFMKELFKYLLSQSFLPLDVKNAIITLQPLVKMIGRAAAPP